MFSRFSSDLKGCRQVAIGASLTRPPPTEHDYLLETWLEHWRGDSLWWAWVRPLEWTHCSKWQQCAGMEMFQDVWKCRASPARFSWECSWECDTCWSGFVMGDLMRFWLILSKSFTTDTWVQRLTKSFASNIRTFSNPFGLSAQVWHWSRHRSIAADPTLKVGKVRVPGLTVTKRRASDELSRALSSPRSCR